MRRFDWHRFFILCGLLVWIFWAPVHGQTPFRDSLVQPPTLAGPQRGSLSGQYAHTAFGPADVSRGAFTLASPFAAPSDRGPMLANPFPVYSADAGISEWGMGWQAALALTRWRAAGDLDYATDELTGPWGRLVQGADGKWYPLGMSARIRAQGQGAEVVAYLPDGSRWTFGGSARIDTPRGTYAWYLREVETATGRKALLTYERNGSGRLFLTSVLYGGVGSDFQYQVDFLYQPLTRPFVDFRSGAGLALDRRVTSVSLKVKQATTGRFAERGRYTLEYLEEGWGPAFYLAGVTQTFASGESAPPTRYTYARAQDHLATETFRRAPKLDAVVRAFGDDAIQANRAALLDINHDGQTDLEHHESHLLLIQTDDGFQMEELPPVEDVEDMVPGCRYEPSRFNPPRTLASMRARDDEYHVVFLRPQSAFTETALTLCNRPGQALYRQILPGGGWALSENTRLIDLNRDHRPDLIRVFMGGYEVIPNLSTADDFAFGDVQSGRLSPRFRPTASWIHDFNGDNVPDIISRFDSGIVVWFGQGNFEFVEEGQTFPIVTAQGQPVAGLANYEFTFVDANKDGLIDLLLRRNNRLYFFVNTGTRFVEQPIPGLSFIDVLASRPVVGDFVGRGHTEIAVVKDRQGYSLALDGAETGLLIAADDGKGTVLHFTYQRSPAVPGTRQRHAVLAQLEVVSSGQESVTYSYAYRNPTLHSVGKFLIGFDAVTRRGAATTQSLSLLNSDAYAGLFLASTQHDENSPLVDSFESKEYEEAAFQGIPWKRLKAEVKGWQATDRKQSVSERTEYLDYENEVCPSSIRQETAHGTLLTTKVRAALPALSNHLHCLETRITLIGQHTDSRLDFRYEGLLERNAVGLVTQVHSDASDGRLTLQEVTYNPDYTVQKVSSPGRGRTLFDYEPARRLLNQVTAPDLQVTQVSDRHGVTDQIRALSIHRGASAFTSYFRYDGQERLAKQWDSLGGASETNPNQTFSYRYATAAQPAAVALATLVDARAGIVKNAIEFATAAGDALTSVRRIPEGWVFDGLTERKPSVAETKSYLRPNAGATADLLSLDYTALFAGVQPLTFSKGSSFGHDVETTARFHEAVEKHVTTTLALDDGQLTQTVWENTTFRTVSTLDAGKRVLVFEDEAGTRYGYRYDALGRLVEVNLPDGTAHRVAYDAHGRVRRVEREGIASIEYAYDSVTGLLTEKRFFSLAGAALRAEAFQYDAIGRKSVETHTDISTGERQIYRYFYDGATPSNPTAQTDRGLLTAVTGEGYHKLFQYRPDGRLRQKTLSLLGWRTIVTQFDYLEDGSVREKTTVVRNSDGAPLATSVYRYTYDHWGRVLNVRFNDRPLAGFQYNENGQARLATFATGETVTLAYDPYTRRPLGLRQQSALWTALSHLQMNNRGLVDYEDIHIHDLNRTRRYDYSPTGFLTNSVDEQTSYTYEFDAFGLPTAIQEGANRRALTRTGDVLSAGDVPYRFDALGRTIEKGDLRFTYGPNGHIARAQRGAAEWTFLYDENGQRILKRAGGVPVAAYLEEGYLEASRLTEPFPVAGRLVGVMQSGRFRLLAVDARGTVTADVDGTPRIASPFGDRVIRPDISAAIDYVQKGYDADLGLLRMGVRDYDAKINRFITPDPLFLEEPQRCLKSPVECNLYAYARSNPLIYIDPTGNQAVKLPDRVHLNALKLAASGKFHLLDSNRRPAGDMKWKGPQPAPKGIAQFLRANFPFITNTGIYNDRFVAGTTVKSAHAEGRALDIHLNAKKPIEKLVADQLFTTLREAAPETGIDNVIWDRQIWSMSRGGPKPYSGKNPHTDHIHVEFTREGSQLKTWQLLEVRIAILRTGLEDLAKTAHY